MANTPKLDPKSLLGRSVIQASGELLTYGIHSRVVMEDGNALPLTEEYIPNRWDLEVEHGQVVGIRIPTP